MYDMFPFMNIIYFISVSLILIFHIFSIII